MHVNIKKKLPPARFIAPVLNGDASLAAELRQPTHGAQEVAHVDARAVKNKNRKDE